jgi:hypothetical protein
VVQKYLIASAFVLTSVFHASGQSDSTFKKVDQYLGVQANQLLRQLFNLGGSSSPINNPYTLVYSLNSKQTGWGFATGLGYTYRQFEEGDPFNPLETTISDFFFRVGVDKKSTIGKKWLAGFGFDILLENLKNETESKSGFGNFKSETKSKVFGFGPRFGLTYSITDRILLGTEATYYFKRTKETQEITNLEKRNEKFKEFSFAVPAVLFVSLRF